MVAARRADPHAKAISLDHLHRTEPQPRPPARAGGRGLHHAHADPGAGHRPCHGGQGPLGHRPDGHRQDRRLRPAHPAPAHGQSPPGPPPRRPRAGALAHARAGQPDRRQLQGLRQAHQHQRRRDLRRREHSPADEDAGARRGRSRRHPRPPAGPPGPAHREPVRDRDLRARRGRPDARPRLHPADPPHHQELQARPPEPVLLRHHAQRDRQTGRGVAAESGAGLRHARVHHGGARRPAAHLRGGRAQARAPRRAVRRLAS